MYLFLLLTHLLAPPSPQTVTVSLNSSVAKAGDLHLAVYATQEAFEAKDDLITIVEPTTDGTMQVDVQLPAAGRYVLAAYHDLNGNGELDTNVFGIPKEPYGFNVEPPSKWRAPKFGELVAEFGEGRAATSEIILKKWKEY
ncbi:MAG: DUF2141 domain-containing protein [Bacteroidota bacterium]